MHCRKAENTHTHTSIHQNVLNENKKQWSVAIT